MTFAELTEQILAFRDARDWAQFHKPKDVAAAVAIEAAELQEHFLWKTHEESTEHLAKHGAAVAEEMADIAIYLFIMAAAAGIDLGQAMQAKLKKNERRFPATKLEGNRPKKTTRNVTKKAVTKSEVKSDRAKERRLAYTRTEAAELLGINPITLDRLAKRGLVNPSRALRRPLYTREELERFLDETKALDFE